ncbi:MAG TPA: toll/interleukin-1 receptor domain-containing protein [Aggregatilineales bacterium]|nr:toll/interleukin-1 receptor domain-containing protein [Aggregatilineales bacterium]
MQVFISYSHKDSEFAEHLYRDLSDFEIDVWMDTHIGPGQRWDDLVDSALGSSEVMIVLVSTASNVSENVKDEWSDFIDKDRTILPCLIEPCEVPYRLRRRNWIDFTRDYELAFQRLIVGLGSPAQSDPERTERIRVAPKSRTSAGAATKGDPVVRAVPSPARPRPAPPSTPASASAPEVAVTMLPVVWSNAYHWLAGMGSNASGGDIMISPREIKLIPQKQPILAIPLKSLASVRAQRSIDPYLTLTYYDGEGKSQSIVLMGGPRNRRAEINAEILGQLKLLAGHSLA